MHLVTFSIRVLLAAVFAIAGAAKLRDRERTKQDMREFGLPTRTIPVLAFGIPWIELGLAAGLLVPRTAWWSAVAMSALLAVFSVAIGTHLARGTRPTCGCFGELDRAPIGLRTLVRTAGLTLLALGVVADRSDALLLRHVWQDLPRPAAEILTAAAGGMFTGMLGLVWIGLAVMRKVDSLARSVEELRQSFAARPPEPDARSERPSATLVVGALAPAFSLEALTGQPHSVHDLARPGGSCLFVFLRAKCHTCGTLLPDLIDWTVHRWTGIELVVIGVGAWEQVRADLHALPGDRVLVDPEGQLIGLYGVIATPSAVLVRDGRIATSMAVGPDAIRALVRRHAVGATDAHAVLSRENDGVSSAAAT